MGIGWAGVSRYSFLALSVFGLGCGTAAALKNNEAAVLKVNPPIVQIPFSLDGLIMSKGQGCAVGTRMVTQSEFESQRMHVCRRFGQWDIVRLAQNASADGIGYQCKSRSGDARVLGASLCVGPTDLESTCYWMENYSGQYRWVTPPSGFYNGQGKARCQALDSCNGGGGASGGGCYKWSTGPEAPRQAWD